MAPRSTKRVEKSTRDSVNRRIDAEIMASIEYHMAYPDEIDERLKELEAEWDIERVLQANAASLALAGTVLGFLGGKRWLLLPAAVSGFLLQHAIEGWCPPLPVLRRLGFRTAHEIAQEYYALKAIRGDFADVKEGANNADAALRAVGLQRGKRKRGSPETA
jgi:hypothetical protein